MSRPSIHSILPKAAIVLAVPAALVLGVVWWNASRPYELPAGQSVFDVAQGTWKWANNDSSCSQVHHTISFSPDHTVMYYRTNQRIDAATGKRDSVFAYDVLSTAGASIRGAMRGETRRARNGELVVWDLVLRSHDTYAWHEADWPRGAYTPSVRRCTPEELHQP